MSLLYFSYGSNMLTSRLTARCSSAKVVGTAIARGHVLEFSKKSIDGSGKATLTKKGNMINTPGVLFEIDRTELDALDGFEGAGKGYDRLDEFHVEIAKNGETVKATTYLAATTHPNLAPFDWYLALVIAGALEHRLGDDHTDILRAVTYALDHNLGRKTRIAALKALADHGHQDHIELLQR